MWRETHSQEEPLSPEYEELTRGDEMETETEETEGKDNKEFDSQSSVRPKIKDTALRKKTQRRKEVKQEFDSSSESGSQSDSSSRKRQREQRDRDGFKLPYPVDEKHREHQKDMRRREKKWEEEKEMIERRRLEDAEEIKKLKAELEKKKVKEETQTEETRRIPKGIYAGATEAQKRALNFFNRMRELDITLQLERMYKDENEEDNRRRLEAGRHYHHESISPRIAHLKDHPKVLRAVFKVDNYRLLAKAPLQQQDGKTTEATLTSYNFGRVEYYVTAEGE